MNATPAERDRRTSALTRPAPFTPDGFGRMPAQA